MTCAVTQAPAGGGLARPLAASSCQLPVAQLPHLQTKSFQYYNDCVQNCAIYVYIGTIAQYIQYLQYVQCLYTILKILFAQQYCTAVLLSSIAHHIAYICVQMIQFYCSSIDLIEFIAHIVYIG